ncbi:MAG: RsmD family RNA methyltransferase, partial [Bacilli bacterium]|nr:RsmD family RNA methyltransferase [Bacilli bacterium]
MRIIAGKHKRLVLNTLEGTTTRPMMDRMKESIFNTIGPFFDGEVVLDLFAGSGALGLEALSRGASLAYFVEVDKDALEIVKKNVLKAK